MKPTPYERGYSVAVACLAKEDTTPYTPERLQRCIKSFETHQYSPNLDEWDLGYIAAFKAKLEEMRYPV